jgi:sugar/nucleoside kinase (ribokinase family)
MDNRTLVIGEALIDIVEGAQTRELVGGSPANVAVAMTAAPGSPSTSPPRARR